MADEQLGLSVVSPVMGVVFFSLYYKAVLEVYKDIRHQPQVIRSDQRPSATGPGQRHGTAPSAAPGLAADLNFLMAERSGQPCGLFWRGDRPIRREAAERRTAPPFDLIRWHGVPDLVALRMLLGTPFLPGLRPKRVRLHSHCSEPLEVVLVLSSPLHAERGALDRWTCLCNDRHIRGYSERTCPPLPPEDVRFDPTSRTSFDSP
jgi:hypothetical protein